MVSVKQGAKTARAFRARMAVSQLDYRRSLVSMTRDGFLQQDIAAAVGITQPTLSKAIKIAQAAPTVREGFSGASVLEICQRYTAGELSQERVIDELSRWEYAPQASQSVGFFDDFVTTTPGSVEELTSALNDGFLDDETYDLILDRL